VFPTITALAFGIPTAKLVLERHWIATISVTKAHMEDWKYALAAVGSGLTILAIVFEIR
jgi:hypothetical protein